MLGFRDSSKQRSTLTFLGGTDMNNMQDHFTTISSEYRDLRTTDTEPIRHIKSKLKNLRTLHAVDVGCGAGRYVLELFEHLPNRLFLHCVDLNMHMLNSLSRFLSANDIRSFKTIQSPAEEIPLKDQSVNCVFTFNAIHHFDIQAFLQETSRLLKPGGFAFIYTRLRSQNARSIWGQFFPKFTQKESRLYEIDELYHTISSFPALSLDEIAFFAYSRTESLEALVDKALKRHYSTFALYAQEEFAQCLEEFKQRLSMVFPDASRICWQDENVMLILHRR